MPDEIVIDEPTLGRRGNLIFPLMLIVKVIDKLHNIC